MSMDKPGVIPVDTHVWQIASRHYLTKLQHSKSLTNKLYDEIGEYTVAIHFVLFNPKAQTKFSNWAACSGASTLTERLHSGVSGPMRNQTNVFTRGTFALYVKL